MSGAPQPPLPAPVAVEAAAGLPARSSPSALTLVRALRPRQWTKNLAAYGPLFFSHSLLNGAAAVGATMAVASFCLLASGVYVLNDWVDREKDRFHPEKRLRPIASGLLSGPMVAVLIAACWGVGGALAYATRLELFAVAAGYVALQVAYIFVLKRVVILDVMVIALGFVIRVAGGGVAIDVPLSNWLYLCTLLLALFLAFAKRRHELSSLQGDAAAHRAILSDYSLPMLDQMISVVAASCILAYGLYTVARETIEHVGSDRLKYSVPCVVFGIFRYLFLIHRRGAGGSPERVLLSDAPLLASIGVFAAIVGWALYMQ
jgi:4-hydroxybenzoate polyprenyltransferase